MILQKDQTGSTRSNKSPIYSIFPLIFFFILCFNFSVAFAKDTTVSIMSYNVENLFDATDDGAKQMDPAYLPLSIKKKWKTDQCATKVGFYHEMCVKLDWTPQKYEDKLKKIAQVLLDYENGGADIIVLQELENRRVLTDLWQKHLMWKGYKKPIHFESPSSRGIDVGMMSRFSLAETPKVHGVSLGEGERPTRDVIEATFQVRKNFKLRVTANHWPSQANSTQMRLRAASVVKNLARQAIRDRVPFIATGDFNTLLEETPNPIQGNIADNFVQNKARPLVDIQDYIGLAGQFPGGSHFYRGAWDMLDRFLASKDLFNRYSKFRIDLRSYEIFAPRYLLIDEYLADPKTGKIRLFTFPQRYDFFTGEGYSDHLPVVMKLTIQN
ncbi:MAG: hypothetical protein A3B70_05990 [Deltaproteobacteria bacterium RIFCSPHIGHO2_02_FULL_40_11]|nr:MAG: hypothetical protein A3B70_05990 [Deltaproteobacteria bacterium RIFCSPHIGHO2_02_FULL_40_11]